MTTSRVGAVIDALVTTLDAGTAAAVYDGPPVTSDAPGDYVLVGCNEDLESRIPLDQTFAGLGRAARDETGDIPVTIVAVSGGTSIKTVRDRALVILGELENALRTDPTLGGAVQSGWLHVTSGEVVQVQNTSGCRAAIPLVVSYKARI